MSSGKGRRGPRVAASDEMGFRDEATAHTLWRTHLPTSSPEDWRLYIDPDGEEREYNISVLIADDRAWQAVEEAKENGEAPPRYDPPPRQRVWPTRRSDRPGETLYRDWGDRLEDDRWILAFSGRDGLLDRELDPEAAAYWLHRINRYALPPGLRHIRPRTTDAAHPRLRPDWRPASRASTPSDDDRQSRPADGRDGLEVPPEEVTEPVVLGGPDDPAFVWGKEKDPLPPAQYRTMKALVEAHGKKRLSQDALHRATADDEGNLVEDPVGALKRLRRRDADWKGVIDMAGKAGRGYGLKDRPPTPTRKNREIHPPRPGGGRR
jgi:hypothetical protein